MLLKKMDMKTIILRLFSHGTKTCNGLANPCYYLVDVIPSGRSRSTFYIPPIDDEKSPGKLPEWTLFGQNRLDKRQKGRIPSLFHIGQIKIVNLVGNAIGFGLSHELVGHDQFSTIMFQIRRKAKGPFLRFSPIYGWTFFSFTTFCGRQDVSTCIGIWEADNLSSRGWRRGIEWDSCGMMQAWHLDKVTFWLTFIRTFKIRLTISTSLMKNTLQCIAHKFGPNYHTYRTAKMKHVYLCFPFLHVRISSAK